MDWVIPGTRGIIDENIPSPTELEPLEFDLDGFLDMNRTLTNPLLSLGMTLSPWLSILGLSLGLAGLTLSCCCLLRQKRLLARMRAHSASENMSFEPRRGPTDHSRTELTEAAVHETRNWNFATLGSSWGTTWRQEVTKLQNPVYPGITSKQIWSQANPYKNRWLQ